jgi:hypothetical protein
MGHQQDSPSRHTLASRSYADGGTALRAISLVPHTQMTEAHAPQDFQNQKFRIQTAPVKSLRYGHL